MAEWSYKNMNEVIDIDLPLLKPTSPNIQMLNQGSVTNVFQNPQSAYQSQVCNVEWPQVGGALAKAFPVSSQTTSNYGFMRGISRIDQHFLSALSEPQRKWIGMVNQRLLDQQYLDNFLRNRIVPKQSPVLQSIIDYRDLSKEAKKLASQLNAAEKMNEVSKNSEKFSELMQAKERLQFIEEQLDDYASRKEIQEKLYKRQEKRKWIKRKKERQKREEEELIIHREKLHELIDNERSIHKHQELNREKIRKAKREADVALGEVRQKKNEVKRLQQLLQSLRELRVLRARSLESQCALFASEESNQHFNNVIGKLDLVIDKQIVSYKKEEESLQAMMKVHQSTTEAQSVQKQWNEYFKRGTKVGRD